MVATLVFGCLVVAVGCATFCVCLAGCHLVAYRFCGPLVRTDEGEGFRFTWRGWWQDFLATGDGHGYDPSWDDGPSDGGEESHGRE